MLLKLHNCRICSECKNNSWWRRNDYQWWQKNIHVLCLLKIKVYTRFLMKWLWMKDYVAPKAEAVEYIFFSLYKCKSRKGDTDRTCSNGIYRLFILWYICCIDRTFSWKSIEKLDKNWIIDEKISTQGRNGTLFAVSQSPSRSCRCLGFKFTLRSSMLT